jgi:sialate O-acetylesterase
MAVCALLSAAPLHAEVRLPSIFSDHMVLLKADKVPVWGKADSGEKVAVSLNGRKWEAEAGSDGSWRVNLDLADSPEGPFEMVVQGENTLKIKDVVVGEVWLGSGQSNMEQDMRNQDYAEGERLKASNPLLRQFITTKKASLKPEDDTEGFWLKVEPGQTDPMSAIGYFFSKKIHGHTKGPVGIIKAPWGGKPIEPFLCPEAFDSSPLFRGRRESSRADLLNRNASFFSWLDKTGRSDRTNADRKPFISGPTSDSEGWVNVKDGGLVDHPALPKYGATWFRKTVRIAKSQMNCPKQLVLGFKNVDFFQVYFNGVLVEAQDQEDHTSVRSINTVVFIKPEVMREGENQMALRIFAPDKQCQMAWAPWFDGVRQTGGWQAKHEFDLPELPKGRRGGNLVPLHLANGSLFDGMIRPLIPYAIRGVLWYQGESNTPRPHEYTEMMRILIEGWRSQWGDANLPFYYFQLANYNEKKAQPGESDWAELREAQLKALSIPNTEMVVLIDTGEVKDIHPQSKDIAGDRLARIALAKVYGQTIPYSGPVYDSMKVEEDKIRLSFKHHDGGLVAKEVPATYDVMRKSGKTAPLVRNSPHSQLEGFAICGADKLWVWAEAKIDGDTVLVSSRQVPAPIAVRYGWADNPTCNLYNQAGLPASPFRTDDFSLAAASPAPPAKPSAVSAPPRANPSAPTPGKPLAITPTPRTDNPGWMKIVERQAAAAKPGRWDLVLIGDSITSGWQSGAPAELWAKHFPAYRTLNLGIAADKTENVLWRLGFPGTLDGYQPKLFILMIGTNNTGHRFGTETADDTAQGVRAILDTLATKAPDAKVLLLAIFPRGEAIKRQRNDEVNHHIKELADNKRVFWLDLSQHFLEPDGTLLERLFMDEKPHPIHLTVEGYETWAKAMQPKIQELTKE